MQSAHNARGQADREEPGTTGSGRVRNDRAKVQFRGLLKNPTAPNFKGKTVLLRGLETNLDKPTPPCSRRSSSVRRSPARGAQAVHGPAGPRSRGARAEGASLPAARGGAAPGPSEAGLPPPGLRRSPPGAALTFGGGDKVLAVLDELFDELVGPLELRFVGADPLPEPRAVQVAVAEFQGLQPHDGSPRSPARLGGGGQVAREALAARRAHPRAARPPARRLLPRPSSSPRSPSRPGRLFLLFPARTRPSSSFRGVHGLGLRPSALLHPGRLLLPFSWAPGFGVTHRRLPGAGNRPDEEGASCEQSPVPAAGPRTRLAAAQD